MQKMLIIGVVVIIIIIGGAIAIFHKSSKPTTNSTTPSTTATTPSNSTNGSAVIQTKSVSNVGQYLADSNGNALYTYGSDTNGVSNCSGSCLYSWPIYAATNAPSTLPTNVTVITRSDGSKQYAYKGMPLYTFTGDSNGKVSGDGVSNFHVAKP